MADLRAGLSQSVHIIDIELVQDSIDAVVEATLLEELAIGVCRGGKAAGNRNTGIGQIADHFAERSIFAPDPLYIVNAQLLEGHYVL